MGPGQEPHQTEDLTPPRPVVPVRTSLGVHWGALVHTDHGRRALGVHWKTLVHTENVTYLKGRFFYSCKSVNFGL